MLLKQAFIYIILSFLSVTGVQANSVHSLKGVITDAKGNPVPGAIVSIPDLKTGAAADSNGLYIISRLPKGNFLVQVRMLGYASESHTVFIQGSTTENFTLNQSVVEANEVVVTGISEATEKRKSAFPITSIGIKELQQTPFSNIVDAIAKLPGVNQVTTGPAISKPVIRGLGGNRILTITDHIRLEGQQWGDEHGIEVDDYNVSKIEVLKGPASLAYGSDALAGVVNIITDEPLQENRVAGEVLMNYQTNSGLAATSAKISGNKNGWGWKAYGTLKAAHDYKNKYDGSVYNSRFQNGNFGAHIGLNKSWGYSRLSFSSFNQKLGIAEGERDPATGQFLKIVNENGTEEEIVADEAEGKRYETEIPYQKISHQKIAWNNLLHLNQGDRIGLTLGFQQNNRKEFGDVLEPEAPALFFSLRTFSYNLRYFFRERNNWKISAGINGMKQMNKNEGREFLIPDYDLTDAGFFVIVRKDFNQWSFSGGARYDLRSVSVMDLFLDSAGKPVNHPATDGIVKFNSFSRIFSNFSASAGASYTASPALVYRLNLASGFRAPNIAELASNGVHEGTIRYEYGSRDLKPEKNLQADLGLEYNSEHLRLNLALYANYITDFIYIRKLAGTNGTDSIPQTDNEQGKAAFIYDQHNALLLGGELYSDFHPHPLDWLHLENTISFVRGKRTGENLADSIRNLPYMPAPTWFVALRAQKNKLNERIKNAYAKIGADIYFEQPYAFSAYQTETTSPGYSLLQAGIGFDLYGKKNKALCSISVAAQNLLDAPYQNHLSRLRFADENPVTGRQGIWGTGRNFSFMVKFPF